MINLVATNQSLELETGFAVSTDYDVEFADHTATTLTPDQSGGNVATATTTTIVAAPGASVQRQITSLFIRNKGSTVQTVIIKKDVAAAERHLTPKIALLAGETLQFDHGAFRVLDANGRLKFNVEVPGTLLSKTVYTSGSGHTFSQQTNRVITRQVAGGGGGGGASGGVASQSAAGGGGAGGGYAEKVWGVTPGSASTHSVGAAGTAGSSGGGNGGAGGNTTVTIGGVTVTATGGPGGTGQTTGTSAVGVNGGAAGAVSTNGDLNGAGWPGHPAWRASGTAAFSGAGGSSPFGAGGDGRVSGGAGVEAVGQGGGGGGALNLNNSGSHTGGAGQEGAVVYEEYS